MENITVLDGFIAAQVALTILLPVFVFSIVFTFLFAFLYSFYIKSKRYKIMVMFLVFSLFGGTIGIFIGGSKAAIVSSILPPIITLISGYLVFVVSKELSTEIKALLPGAVIVLLVTLLFSAFYMKSWFSVL